MASTEEEKKKARIKAQNKYRQSEKYRISYVSSHLKRTYGITIEQYNELLAVQNNCCAICGTEGRKRIYVNKREQLLPLFVDHCHKTNKVRGLLCNKCNVGLAMYNENIESFLNAIIYLKENNLE